MNNNSFYTFQVAYMPGGLGTVPLIGNGFYFQSENNIFILVITCLIIIAVVFYCNALLKILKIKKIFLYLFLITSCTAVFAPPLIKALPYVWNTFAAMISIPVFCLLFSFVIYYFFNENTLKILGWDCIEN